jgi:hypothetical protein
MFSCSISDQPRLFRISSDAWLFEHNFAEFPATVENGVQVNINNFASLRRCDNAPCTVFFKGLGCSRARYRVRLR